MTGNTYKLQLVLTDGTVVNAGDFTAPQGPKGDKGDKGEQGDQGTAVVSATLTEIS